MSYSPEIYNPLSPVCEKLGIENTPDLNMVKSANKHNINTFNIDVNVEIESSGTFGVDDVPPEVREELENRLRQVNGELERYTNHADGVQYAYAIACGIISGAIDSAFFADTTMLENDIGFSHRQVNEFIQEYAASRGLGGDRLKDAIRNLEQTFKVAQDNVWKAY